MKADFRTTRPALLRRSSSILAIAMALASGAYAEGVRQSPINIDSKAAVEVALPSITATYLTNATLSVVNTYNPNRLPYLHKEWATLRATPSGTSFVMVGGQQYNLLQFHFHTPSEHKINEKRSPMEVHFVHLRAGALPCDPEALLVIGALIKQDDATHNELNKIFGAGQLPEDSLHGTFTVNNFDLNKVLPKLDDSWRYAGSLTAPSTFTNCTAQGGSIEDQLSADIFPENVQWVVLTRPIGMSQPQISTFRHIFEEGNTRATQPLHGRTVTRVRQ